MEIERLGRKEKWIGSLARIGTGIGRLVRKGTGIGRLERRRTGIGRLERKGMGIVRLGRSYGCCLGLDPGGSERWMVVGAAAGIYQLEEDGEGWEENREG